MDEFIRDRDSARSMDPDSYKIIRIHIALFVGQEDGSCQTTDEQVCLLLSGGGTQGCGQNHHMSGGSTGPNWDPGMRAKPPYVRWE